jgi:hypothetical protein
MGEEINNVKRGNPGTGEQITTKKGRIGMGEEINNGKRGNPGTGEHITTNKRKNRDGRGDKQWKERESK